MAEIFNFYVQDNRTILFPSKNLLEPIMQEDKDVATWRFRIPKVLNEIDMSQWAWWFVYVNANGQEFSELLTLTDDIDEPSSYSTADYDIDYGISKFPGSFSFALEAISTEQGGEIDGEWHTKTYKHKVDGTLQGNQAEFTETESDIISALIVEVQNKVNALVGGATPEVKDSIAEMTDHKKIYVLSTDGNWYRYNGTTWVSGGQYASGITIDHTLTQSGQAADAKVTGDEIAKLLSLDSDNAIIVPANSNFNDYLTPGNYKVQSISIAETIDNIPYESGGRLTVVKTTQSDRIVQVYWVNSSISISIYYRFYNNSWGDWIQFTNDSTVNSKVALNTTRDAYLRSNNSIQFTKNGTSITVKIPFGLVHYLDVDGKMLEKMFSANNTVEITVPHDHFAIYSITDSAIEVKSLTELKALSGSNYIPLFYNSSGNVRGLWRKYWIEQITAVNTERDVYPYSGNEVIFEKSGTTITFQVAKVISHYKTSDGKILEYIYTPSGSYSVPHDSFAIYNIDNKSIEVKSLSELRTLSSVNYITMFYNSSGNVRGLWEKYVIAQKVNYQADVYFYGINTYPTFKFLSDYSIDVTIPNNARVNYYDYSVFPPLFKNGAGTNISAQTINVPHDKCLVYDISTRGLSVEDFNFNYDERKAVLFYNSHGIVNGQWYRYYLRQLDEETKNGYSNYFRTHITDRIDTINTMLTEQGASAMLFITDHHYPSNRLKSVGIVDAVCKESGITKVFLGGDYINRETLKAEALRNINRIAGMYIYPGVKTFRLCGNHEFNNPGASTDQTIVANQLTRQELRHAILNTFIGDVTADENSLSYFYDDKINKIRFIVGSVTYTSSLDANSVKWVCNQLTQVPSGWSTVVLFHTILKYADGITSPVNSATNLINVLDAFKQKSNYTFDGVTYDFASINAELICAICGDMHVDTDYVTEGGVHIIATTTDSMQELGELTRVTGDITEVAFDVFVFNTTQKSINCIRIGAGQDRTFEY